MGYSRGMRKLGHLGSLPRHRKGVVSRGLGLGAGVPGFSLCWEGRWGSGGLEALGHLGSLRDWGVRAGGWVPSPGAVEADLY